MDPTTTVVLLTLNLAVTGGLVAAIARRSASQRPLLQCAASVGLFALAYIGRLLLGHSGDHPLSVLPDATMVFAGMLFLRGQRQFMPRPVPALRYLVWVGLAYGAVHALLTAALGQQARHISLNGTLALLYLGMARTAWIGQRSLTPAERPALRLMMLTAGLLGGATVLRALDAVLRGVPTLFDGPTAQAYYALSSICVLLMGPAVLWWMFTRLTQQLHQLATHDPLTRVLNRNGLAQALRGHFAARVVRPMIWLMVDLDHFKRVNDTLGHRSGDHLLELVARTLVAQVRAEDLVARLGGEEFVVGIVDASLQQAEALAERLRSAVAALRFTTDAGQPWPCSVSIGVSPPFDQATQWEPALGRADQALYRAKAEGRNRVVVATPALA